MILFLQGIFRCLQNLRAGIQERELRTWSVLRHKEILQLALALADHGPEQFSLIDEPLDWAG